MNPDSATAAEKEIVINRAERFSKAWKNGLGLALILVIAAALRLQHIKADPPLLLPSISGSAGIYFDEGIYCHNARNKILFGRWITDEWNPIVYNAPLTLIYYLGFKLFGLSIVTVKVINILFGLLGILLFHTGLRSYLTSGQALALASLFALDYYGVMYNRLGLLENFSCFCFLLGFCLFVRSRGRHTMAFLLGLTVTMAALSKYLFVYFLIAALLAVMDQARRRSDFKFLLSFLAGGLTIGLPWLFGIYLPFRSSFAKIGSGWGMLSLPHSLTQAWDNLVHNPLARYLPLLPVVAFLLILFIGLMLLKLLRPKAWGVNEPYLFIFLWIAGAALSMGLLNYRPLRYYLPLMPALYLAISALIKNRDTIAAERRPFWALTLIPVLFFLPFFRNLAFGPSAFFVFPPGLRWLSYISMAAAVLYFITPRPKWKTLLEVLVLAVMLGSSLFLYFRHFYQTPTYNLEAASRYLRTLPPGSVVMGQEAPRLTLETPFKALMAYENWFNDRDPFVRYKPTHLLVLNRFGDAELAWIKRRFPETARGLRLIRKFRVWDTTLTLYGVPESPPPN
jgi:4-amino-4-deoxy-L-arabinose transferase-like glycosyltransferase